MAIAILGWPVEKLSAGLAQKVIEGGRSICTQAGIPLAGGHSIDSPEPIFGLAVTGIIAIENLKKNNTANAGDLLFLTKRLGTGILSTAQKKGLLKKDHLRSLIEQMTTLNKTGEELGKIRGVTAMTDVTGFGLLGHLIEMAEGSGLSSELFYEKIQMLDGTKEYIHQRIFPGATSRNWNSYSNKVQFQEGVNEAEAITLLPDPQTNGGLLIAVKENIDEVKQVLRNAGLEKFLEPIGKMIPKRERVITVK
jgi:selenide,water dikinase